jgi:hypothetical protein
MSGLCWAAGAFIFKAGGFLALFGAYLVWIDFLSPNREQP